MNKSASSASLLARVTHLRGASSVALTVALGFAASACASADGSDDAEDPSAPPGTVDAPADPIVEESAYIADDGDGAGAISLDQRFTRERMSDGELTRMRAERARAGIASGNYRAPALSMTEHTLRHAATLPIDEIVDVSIQLEDEPYAFQDFREADDARRAALIDDRKAQLGKSQDALEERIAALGGNVESRSWLVNAVDARVPAGRLAELSRLPGVVTVVRNKTAEFKQEAGWYGTDTRKAMLLDSAGMADGKRDFYAGCFSNPQDPATCHDAMTGNRLYSTIRQRIAIVEVKDSEWDENWISPGHPGFKTAAGSPKVLGVFDCSSSGCTSFNPGHGDWGAHGTEVAGIAAGSIESGQDPNHPGTRTTKQRNRSGVAKEAAIIYLRGQVSDMASVRKAVETAVAAGADVINMSWGEKACNNAEVVNNVLGYDPGLLHSTFLNALNAGALPVKSAGNIKSQDGKCSMTYPGWFPSVLTVGGLHTDSSNLDINTTGMYADGNLGSATGGVPLRVSGLQYTYSGIDLVAPACSVFGYSYNEGVADYFNSTSCGTSGAAPVVAGTAALLRDALNYLGGGWASNGKDAHRLLNLLLVMGDGWNATTNTKPSSGVSTLSGYGRLRPHWPSSNNMSSPWGWGSQKMTIRAGETLSWTVGGSGPESTSVTSWKWALTWFDPDLANSSDIVINVVDSCAGNAVVAQDWSFDPRKRIRLTQSQISNRCLVMQARAFVTPAAGTTFYTSDYYHSGNYLNQH